MSSGAHFEALDEPVLVAASDLRCLFFPFHSNPFHLNGVGPFLMTVHISNSWLTNEYYLIRH